MTSKSKSDRKLPRSAKSARQSQRRFEVSADLDIGGAEVLLAEIVEALDADAPVLLEMTEARLPGQPAAQILFAGLSSMDSGAPVAFGKLAQAFLDTAWREQPA